MFVFLKSINFDTIARGRGQKDHWNPGMVKGEFRSPGNSRIHSKIYSRALEYSRI